MALHFASLGAKVFVIGRREEPLKETCEEIRKAGGTAALWRDAGFVVKLVSLTDGRAGHHLTPGEGMAARRRAEARAAGDVIKLNASR